MLPDIETLKSLLSDLQTSGAGSRLRVATRTIESMRVELLAEVIRLREEQARDLCDVDNFRGMARKHMDERDEARAEVERLREQLNPTTPAGKLSAYRAAEAMVENPPKVASWEFDIDEDGYKTGDLVSADGRGLAQFFRTDLTGWFGVVNGDVLDGGESPPLDGEGPENVIRWCEGCAKAAGWELVGGSDV